VNKEQAPEENMTLREKAENLNISPHTLRNWQKRNKGTVLDRKDLARRANKLNSSQLSIPVELLVNPENRTLLNEIREHLLSLPLSPEGRILFFSIYFLHFLKLLRFSRLPQSGTSLAQRVRESETADIMRGELETRLNSLSPEEQNIPLAPGGGFRTFFKGPLKKEADLPGLLYQSLRKEGFRSRQGAWFTPLSVIDSMLRPFIRSRENLFDPCCGSGLYLCRFAEKKGTPLSVRGVDKDPFSVFLTRLNLFCRFPGWTDFEAIREGDSLKDSSWNLGSQDIVVTNPPWGAHLSPGEKREIKRLYPEIKSWESASLFLLRCIQELPEGGQASFLLPESLFYVQTHQDIREFLLNKAPPVRLVDRGRLFKGVYTPALSCDFIKGGIHRKVSVKLIDCHHEKQSLVRYRKNPGKIINYYCREKSLKVFRKIQSAPTQQLPEDCRWLLGVVSGDNKRFVHSKPSAGSVPLLTGKEIRPFYHATVCRYLKIDDGPLQQNLPMREYAVPKLVYRFIGYTPLFSLDREGLVTLNSANSLIPPPGMAPEELVFWYNSALFRFIWFNQFRSVKMLRRHLEQIPIPLWENHQKMIIHSLVKKAENRQDVRSVMDEMIFRHFNLTDEEISIVFSQV